jgi:IclR family KDG regulon transcriptional repressor
MATQDSLSSVYNAIRILREFTNEEPELGITELSRRLGLAKSTVFRLMRTLNDDSLVEKNEKTQKYHLGITAFELGFAAYHGNELRMIAYPLLNKLLKVVREPVHLGVYDRGEIVFICKRIPESHKGTISKLGKRAPVHCIASGKVLLAHQSAEEIERVMQRGLNPYTAKTITSAEKMMHQLEDIRNIGYGVGFSEYNEGYSSVGVPVWNDQGEIVAAISVAVSKSYLYPNEVQNYVKEMKMYSRLITERLDYE